MLPLVAGPRAASHPRPLTQIVIFFRGNMINSKANPVEWTMLMYELEDAHEHLSKLIHKMQESGSIDVESYAVDVAHIYAHLNRAWNSRDFVGEMDDSQWESFRPYPNDLEPIA